MKSRRSYRSPIRERQAAATRQTIADSARALFLERGYSGTTVEAIATAAGVAPQTVVAAFGNKRGVFAEVLTRRARDDEFEQLKQDVGRGTGRERLRLVAHIARRMYEATAQEFGVLIRGAAGVAPELAELVESIDEQKRVRQAFLAEQLANRGKLREGLAAAEAGDIIFALTRHDLYYTLVGQRGWTPHRYEMWLAELLSASLLKRPRGRRPAAPS